MPGLPSVPGVIALCGGRRDATPRNHPAIPSLSLSPGIPETCPSGEDKPLHTSLLALPVEHYFEEPLLFTPDRTLSDRRSRTPPRREGPRVG
jgi:hypothetical protein